MSKIICLSTISDLKEIKREHGSRCAEIVTKIIEMNYHKVILSISIWTASLMGPIAGSVVSFFLKRTDSTDLVKMSLFNSLGFFFIFMFCIILIYIIFKIRLNLKIIMKEYIKIIGLIPYI